MINISPFRINALSNLKSNNNQNTIKSRNLAPLKCDTVSFTSSKIEEPKEKKLTYDDLFNLEEMKTYAKFASVLSAQKNLSIENIERAIKKYGTSFDIDKVSNYYDVIREYPEFEDRGTCVLSKCDPETNLEISELMLKPYEGKDESEKTQYIIEVVIECASSAQKSKDRACYELEDDPELYANADKIEKIADSVLDEMCSYYINNVLVSPDFESLIREDDSLKFIPYDKIEQFCSLNSDNSLEYMTKKLVSGLISRQLINESVDLNRIELEKAVKRIIKKQAYENAVALAASVLNVVNDDTKTLEDYLDVNVCMGVWLAIYNSLKDVDTKYEEISVRLPSGLNEKLTKAAEERKLTKSQLISDALGYYFAKLKGDMN